MITYGITVTSNRVHAPTPKFLVVAAGILAVCLATGPHLDFLGNGLVPIAQALLPLTCLVGLVLAGVLMIWRRTRIPATILLMGVVVGAIPLLVPHSATAAPTADDLTVLSLNAEVGNANVSQLATLVRTEDVDVVVLVETDEDLINALLATEVGAQLQYRSGAVTPGGTSGSAILSRFDLKEEPGIAVPPGVVAFDQPVVTLQHPTLGSVRVAGVHPFPPLGGGTNWHGGLQAISAWQANHTDIPLVLAGDFNASYAHPSFRRIASSFADTATAGGIFPVSTWPAYGAVPPFTAIDHVLVRGLAPTAWERIAIDGTDHFGILASVR